MSDNNKILKEATVDMAVMDMIPVILFGMSMAMIGSMYRIWLFAAGAALCVLAGFGKALWKLILAISHKSITLLNRQFRYTMSAGFLLVILSLIIFHKRINLPSLWENVSSFPGIIMFIVAIAGMIIMMFFAKKPDSSSPKANYIEQAVNLVAQFGFFLGILLIWYASDSYKADENAKAALVSDEVMVETQDDVIWFQGENSQTALIFYPGAKVEYTSYAPLLHELAKGGMDCFLVKMPYNMAIFGKNSADMIIDGHKDKYEKWYVGGHSLGGAMAASYAAGHMDELDGLVLCAAYSTVKIEADNFRVISVYGSEDGVLNKEKYSKYTENLPDDFCEYIIEGGNHAGFGSYGEQSGDNQAGITRQEQWKLAGEEILKYCLGGK